MKGVTMNNVHYSPGRLRLKFPELKNRLDLAKSLEAAMWQLNGVGLVQTNTITGTFLIHYTVREQQEQQLLADVRRITNQLGMASPDYKPSNANRAPLAADSDRIVQTLVNMAIGKYLEHAGLGLLRVLL
jgi:hypothetical protein